MGLEIVSPCPDLRLLAIDSWAGNADICLLRHVLGLEMVYALPVSVQIVLGREAALMGTVWLRTFEGLQVREDVVSTLMSTAKHAT